MFKEQWKIQIAEAKDIFYGLNLSANYGNCLVVLESDCQSIVNPIQLHAQGGGIVVFQLMLDDNYHAMDAFHSVSIGFISPT